MKKFNEYLKIGDAAKLLGLTENTLRNWEKEGNFKTYRHPINNYRLYDVEELKELLANIKR